MLTAQILIQQMLAFDTEGLPSRWQFRWQAMKNKLSHEEYSYTLQEWLEEVYFDTGKQAEFTREDIASVGMLIERMLKLEPSARAKAKDALGNAWFDRA